MDKLPPIEKVCEAWSAVVDGRVTLEGPDKATVKSSDGTKTYTIVYDPSTETYASNDNATYWTGVMGYPIMAVMMLRGALPIDMGFAQQWANINWNALNAQHKRNYAAAVRQIEDERGISPEETREKAEVPLSILKALPIKVKRLKVES